ncbi:hypothetical protein ACFL3F_02485 [Planctomycetota bacterium]
MPSFIDILKLMGSPCLINNATVRCLRDMQRDSRAMRHPEVVVTRNIIESESVLFCPQNLHFSAKIEHLAMLFGGKNSICGVKMETRCHMNIAAIFSP